MFSTNFHEKSKKALFYSITKDPEGGENEICGMRSPEELDAAVLKVTEVIPVTMEEIIDAVREERKPVTDSVKRLLDEGELVSRTEGDNVKFIRVKEGKE